jgi:hypothetical protein
MNNIEHFIVRRNNGVDFPAHINRKAAELNTDLENHFLAQQEQERRRVNQMYEHLERIAQEEKRARKQKTLETKRAELRVFGVVIKGEEENATALQH